MLLDQIRMKKNEISALAAACGATNVRVFGSVARGEEKGDSDIDVLVCLPRGYDFFKRMELSFGLEGLFGRSVDLVPEHELNKYIRASVLKEAVAL